MISARLLNEKKVRRRIKRTIPDAVISATVNALEKNAEEITELAKTLAPKGATKKLVNSIGWTWGDAPRGAFTIGQVFNRRYSALRITIFAGSDEAFYARMQEFGTRNMAANPYFFPAYRVLRRRSRSRVTREMNKAIKRGYGL